MTVCAGFSLPVSGAAKAPPEILEKRAASPTWRTPITMPVAPHAVTSPIGMMATAQVCAAIPNFLVQEWHWIDSPELWRNWVRQGEIIQKASFRYRNALGLGVE